MRPLRVNLDQTLRCERPSGFGESFPFLFEEFESLNVMLAHICAAHSRASGGGGLHTYAHIFVSVFVSVVILPDVYWFLLETFHLFLTFIAHFEYFCCFTFFCNKF